MKRLYGKLWVSVMGLIVLCMVYASSALADSYTWTSPQDTADSTISAVTPILTTLGLIFAGLIAAVVGVYMFIAGGKWAIRFLSNLFGAKGKA